jgi:CRP/FNR family transcriptional regulator, cyclic AMP receptor protein
MGGPVSILTSWRSDSPHARYSNPVTKRAIYLLDADPDLADVLDDDVLEEARRHLVTGLGHREVGPWDAPGAMQPAPGALGMLLLDGVAVRDVEVSGRAAMELLGSGDLLRPWDTDQDLHAVQPEVKWTVVAPLRWAFLDQRFTALAARWPPLLAAIVQRAMRRSRALVFHLAVTQITGVEQRLLLVLWELAHRWGRVGPDGVRLRLNITHAMLAQLVGARRPSVTTALRTLGEHGLVTQEGPGRWILHGSSPSFGDDDQREDALAVRPR